MILSRDEAIVHKVGNFLYVLNEMGIIKDEHHMDIEIRLWSYWLKRKYHEVY